ncbi:MAG: hypothetical protein L6V93_09390 [Clostridiales bacterium]|nr:MAG: hypothetical protein L6V93_09390 [Clostridiales bacterium]
MQKLKNLYTTAFELIDDYNAYVPSKHIESLTGIRYYENVYSSLYYLIALIIGFCAFVHYRACNRNYAPICVF